MNTLEQMRGLEGSQSDRTRVVLLAIVAVVGFGFLQGARLLDLNSGPYSAHPFTVLGLVVDGITFIVVALLSYTGRIDSARPLFLAALVTSTAYAVLIISGLTNNVALIGMQITAGMGWALSILCWMKVLVGYRPVFAMPMVALAYAINTIIPPLSSTLFPDSRQTVLLVVFALSMVALWVCLRKSDYITHIMHEPVEPTTSMREAFSRTRRAAASAFAFSFVCGFMVEIDIFNGLQYAQTDLTGYFGIAVALGMFAFLVIVRPKKGNIDYISPIAALALVSVLLYRSLAFANPAAAGSLMTTFLMAFYVMLWFMLISEAYERKLPVFFLLGLVLGVARLSVALGRFIAQGLMEQALLNLQIGLVVAVWVLVVALCLIFFSYLRYSAKVRAHCYDEPAEDVVSTMLHAATESAIGVLKDIYQLSNREAEIIGEYAAGRSARYIADKYVISEHTVKTHLRHAYVKLDVHSRQELLDLMEAHGKER